MIRFLAFWKIEIFVILILVLKITNTIINRDSIRLNYPMMEVHRLFHWANPLIKDQESSVIKAFTLSLHHETDCP